MTFVVHSFSIHCSQSISLFCMKFLIKQEYKSPSVPHKICLCVGIGRGEIHTPELRIETGFLFRLGSPTHSSIINSQKLGTMNFFPACVMLFLSITDRGAVCCVVFQFKLTKMLNIFVNWDAMHWIKEFANKCDDRIGRTIERDTGTIGLDERWEGGWKRGGGGEVVDKINRIIGRGYNYDNYWVMKDIKRPRTEPLWSQQSVSGHSKNLTKNIFSRWLSLSQCAVNI